MELFCFLILLIQTTLIRRMVHGRSLNDTSTDDENTKTLIHKSSKCIDVWCHVRLPNYIIPYHYSLKIKADVKRLRFEGRQTAFISVFKSTDTLVIHTKEMNISAVVVTGLDTGIIQNISKQFEYTQNEFYVIILKRMLPIGNYSLTLDFNAMISTKLTGFYKSTYKEKGGNVEVLLTTKFQPTDARKAFPCFDEPNLKATIDIRVIHPHGYHARSNMPGITTSDDSNDWLLTTFQRTVKMSTYLVAFIVSKFEFKFNGIAGIDNDIQLQIWSRPEYVNMTEYAFNTSKTMMNYIQDFLNVKYSLPKLDMYAIPDYGSGATEHWGIITYRESRLLYQHGVTSRGVKQSIASIISHEIAHFWFGNLVTCKWWNDLWVQEGMASYMEYYLLDHAHPEWKMSDTYLENEVLRGLKLDALQSSHPLSQPLTHPKQIKEIFDTITYRKGASLFGMLDAFLGSDLFRKGLNLYLTRHAYMGATVNDVWESFSEVSGMDIKAMMNTWTLQMGFPLINIKRIDNNTYSLTQERFLLEKGGDTTENDEISRYGYKWIIPFRYTSSDNLEEANAKVLRNVTTMLNSTADWLLGNYQHKGFYRVNYDAHGWENIITNMLTNHLVFSTTDRAGLLDDAFSLARAGTVPYSIPFRLSKYLSKETNHVVWKVFLGNMKFIDTVLASHDCYGLFRNWYLTLLKVRVTKQKSFSNPRLIKTACEYGDEMTIRFVKKSFKSWINNGTSIPANIRKQVYFCAVANGADKEWRYVYEMYKNASNPAERSNLQYALSATQKPWLLTKWLRYTVDPNKVRSQDTVYIIRDIATRNPIGKVYAWQFAENNWEKLMGIAKENNFHVNVLISGLTSRFTSAHDLRRVESLWKKYPDSENGRLVRQQSIEHITTNINWLKKNSNDMELLFVKVLF